MTAIKSITIDTYEIYIDHGNAIRVEGSGWSKNVEKTGTVEGAVRKYLASGDYSEGGAERIVVVDVDGERHGEYTATQIRAF